jgi:tetratricopeptide (TPR) repeat protein
VSLRRPRAAASVGSLVVAFAASVANSAQAGQQEAVATAQGELSYVSQNLANVQSAVAVAKSELQTPEQRLANGELLFRMGDYDRATVILSEILEEFPDTPSYPDALWLLGETYYAKRDYLEARRDYNQLVDHGTEPRFQAYFGRALARLVDVSLRLDEPPEKLAPIFEKFNLVPPAQVDAALLYAKGKAYFRTGSWSEAAQAFAQVARGTPYTHQARYFEGLVAMKAARAAPAVANKEGGARPNYKPAIEAFRAATELPPDTSEHRHVVDLAWMAIGRLFYEMEQYQQATEAYSMVGRDSPEFDTMLYELAWVYVRIGDVQRAERALEVLSVSDPNSPYVGDGTLLRADLLLRAGAFDRALQLYETVRTQYDPMRAKVDAFLGSTKDVSAYYDKLAQQQLDVFDQKEDQSEQLPPIAIRWAREAEDGELAFAVIEDVNSSKALLRRANQMVDRLTALTQTPTRVRAFPELEAGERTALGLLNRLSRARLVLARQLDEDEPSELGGEVGDVRAHRRALMASVQDLPVAPEDFGQRDQVGTRRWNTLSQALTERSMEVDALQASINGLHRLLSDGPQQGVARDPASIQRFQAELDAEEREIGRYRELLGELRREVEMGRAEVGLGDMRYQYDALARIQFRDLLDREMQLVASGAAGAGVQPFGRTSQPLLVWTRENEDKLVAIIQDLEKQVAARSAALQGKIEAERQNIVLYQQQLDAIDGNARDVVGHVAQRNFGLVRDRLRGIVLRADVGVTEEAWEVREEELDRVRTLQTDRARQEQVLDEELKEVRDDGVEPTQPTR